MRPSMRACLVLRLSLHAKHVWIRCRSVYSWPPANPPRLAWPHPLRFLRLPPLFENGLRSVARGTSAPSPHLPTGQCFARIALGAHVGTLERARPCIGPLVHQKPAGTPCSISSGSRVVCSFGAVCQAAPPELEELAPRFLETSAATALESLARRLLAPAPWRPQPLDGIDAVAAPLPDLVVELLMNSQVPSGAWGAQGCTVQGLSAGGRVAPKPV